MSEIDTGITEQELFDLILAEGDMPLYDPAKHLHPKVAAERWHISENNARDRLAKDPRLKRIKARSPQTNVEMTVFVPA